MAGESFMARKTFFLRGCQAVDKNKKTYEEKAQETKQHSARLAEMQKYVDMSEEKRNLLLDIVLNGRSSDSDESLLEKGVVIYEKYLDVIAVLEQDFKKHGVEVYVIQGSTKEKDRGRISKEFRGNPKSKVILISDAAGESLSINGTNELILYSLPGGASGRFNQLVGRVARCFSHFESEGRSFYIHYVIVEDTLDVYKPILLSSKKELDEAILNADTIPLKGTKSFDGELLKRIRKDMLWKEKERRKNKGKI